MTSWQGIDEVVAIAETGSFIAAARRLGVSSSHISRAVARLEATIDTRIFERTTRSVRLTDVGRTLVEQCRRIIDEREEALQMVRAKGEMQGEVRVTCSTALGERFVVPIVRDYLDKHPKISIDVELTNRIVDLISEGYDIGIRTGNTFDTRLAARQIASRSLVTCASPQYLERHGAPAHPLDLADHCCLVGTNRTWHYSEKGRGLAFAASGRWRCNSGTAVAAAAVAGMGICQLPTLFVIEELESGQLVRILDDFREAPEPVWAVYAPRRYFVPKVRGLIDWLEASLADAIP